MHRATPRLLEDVQALIAEAKQRHPEWLVLIEPLEETARSLDDPIWAAAAAGAEFLAKFRPDAPILDGASVPVPAEALRIAPLLAASIRGETDDVPASLAAMPLLHACARTHAQRIPPNWPHGYCPVCGAWPVLAELVGMDRGRHLRCGRCAADWPASWLRCPYCGEHDHERLARLVPEATRETRYVEICESCGGYLKTMTTLRASGPIELTIKDLDTVELDVAALEAGFKRPKGLGFSVDVRLAAR